MQVGSPLAPVTEYVAPAPEPPVYTTSAVTTGDNSGLFSLVYPQISSTAVEPVAPRVVASLPPVEEFAEPVYDQVHQELFTASESTENIAEFPVVHEQVIVQEIPDVSGPLPHSEEFSAPVYDHVHQEQISASEMMVDFEEILVVHEQVIVQDIPEVFVLLPPAQEFSAPVNGQVHQVFVGMRPERVVDARGPQRCVRTVPSVGAPVLGGAVAPWLRRGRQHRCQVPPQAGSADERGGGEGEGREGEEAEGGLGARSGASP